MAQITVTGQLLNGLDEPIVGEYVYFRVTGAGTDETNDVVYPRKTFTLGPSDSNGDLPSDAIWVNGDSGVQSYYEIRLPGQERVDVVIPSGTTGTIDLSTILTTYRVNTSTQQNTVYTDAINRANHTGGPDDLNGNEIILDADGDTSITADTDDQIDIKVGGTDEYFFTASAFDVNGNEIVLDVDGDTSITADTDDQIDFKIGGSDALALTATKAGYLNIIDQNLNITGTPTFDAVTASINFLSSEFQATTAITGARLTNNGGLACFRWGANLSTDCEALGQMTVNGRAVLDGGVRTPTTSVTTTTYTALVTDSVLLVNDTTAGGAVTVTLPAAATAANGFQLTIMKIGNTANVIIDGNGAETINGATTQTLTGQYESIKIITNGTAWFIIEA